MGGIPAGKWDELARLSGRLGEVLARAGKTMTSAATTNRAAANRDEANRDATRAYPSGTVVLAPAVSVSTRLLPSTSDDASSPWPVTGLPSLPSSWDAVEPSAAT